MRDFSGSKSKDTCRYQRCQAVGLSAAGQLWVLRQTTDCTLHQIDVWWQGGKHWVTALTELQLGVGLGFRLD